MCVCVCVDGHVCGCTGIIILLYFSGSKGQMTYIVTMTYDSVHMSTLCIILLNCIHLESSIVQVMLDSLIGYTVKRSSDI